MHDAAAPSESRALRWNAQTTSAGRSYLMSTDQVRKWVTTNDYFESDRVQQGHDCFVPNNARYPHIHIGKDYIVYSKSSGNHSHLIEPGDSIIRHDRIHTALQEEAFQKRGNPCLVQLLRYMSSQL
jgi:hypothetical protein